MTAIKDQLARQLHLWSLDQFGVGGVTQAPARSVRDPTGSSTRQTSEINKK